MRLPCAGLPVCGPDCPDPPAPAGIRIRVRGDLPAAGGVDKAVWWETTWCNDTIGVVLMTIALVLLFRKIKADGGFYRRIVLPVSKASYGMYLCHMLVLLYVSGYVREWLCPDSLGFWTTPVAIFLSAIASFILVAVF